MSTLISVFLALAFGLCALAVIVLFASLLALAVCHFFGEGDGHE